MSKIAIITDTHFGVSNDSKVFAKHQHDFFHKQFFPYIDENPVDRILHLGDVCDRRKFINYVTAENLVRDLIKPINDRDITFDCIIGNHDCFYKNTNEVNSMKQLFTNTNFNVRYWWKNPIELEVDGLLIGLCPWICDDNAEETFKFLRTTEASVIMGHFSIEGFQMHKGMFNHDGLDKNIFKKFEKVLSGHFHHRSTYGNISYLGAPYQMTWNDYDDKCGFHILDTKTLDLEFIENPRSIFHKIMYNDNTGFDFTPETKEILKDSFVKVVVQERDNEAAYNQFFAELQSCECKDIKVIEGSVDSFNDDEVFVDEAQDTLTIIRNYVNDIDTSVDREKVVSYMSELYQKAGE